MKPSAGDAVKLFHQKHRASTLDFACDLAVQMGWHAGDPAGNDLPGFGNEAFQKVWIFIIDGFHREIDSAAGHWTVGAPEVRAALWCFWLHGWLFDFPVQGMPFEVRVVLFLFKTARSFGAFLVTFAHVARYGFSFRPGFGAFQRDDFLCHGD